MLWRLGRSYVDGTHEGRTRGLIAKRRAGDAWMLTRRSYLVVGALTFGLESLGPPSDELLEITTELCLFSYEILRLE